MVAKALEIHPAALAELGSAVGWYLKRNQTAAVKFSDEVDRVAATSGALCVLEKPLNPALLCDWLRDALDDDE